MLIAGCILRSFVDCAEVPGFCVPSPNERVLKVVFSPELGNSENVTVLLSIVAPRTGTTGLHTHESTEIMYVVGGRGIATIGDRTKEIGVDTVLVAGSRVLHEVKNKGDDTLKLVCFFVPALKPTENVKKAIELARDYFEK